MSFTERPIVARNSWLVRPLADRASRIAGVMLHSTRSGTADGDDGPRTEGWWSNPLNIVQDTPPWGSYADVLIDEDGTRVICTDWDIEYATWTAGYGGAGTWAAGIYYIQIEIAQGTLLEPFTDAAIESLAEKVRALSIRYGFPIERISFLDQTGVPPRGICTHEGSANGVKTGKTDPGPMFPWERFLELARGEEAMPVEDGWAYFTDDANPQYDPPGDSVNGIRVTGGVYRREFEYWQRVLLGPQLDAIWARLTALEAVSNPT